MSERTFKCQGSDGKIYTVIGRPNYTGETIRVQGELQKVRAGFVYELDSGEEVVAIGGDDYRIVGTNITLTIIRNPKPN